MSGSSWICVFLHPVLIQSPVSAGLNAQKRPIGAKRARTTAIWRSGAYTDLFTEGSEPRKILVQESPHRHDTYLLRLTASK